MFLMGAPAWGADGWITPVTWSARAAGHMPRGRRAAEATPAQLGRIIRVLFLSQIIVAVLPPKPVLILDNLLVICRRAAGGCECRFQSCRLAGKPELVTCLSNLTACRVPLAIFLTVVVLIISSL